MTEKKDDGRKKSSGAKRKKTDDAVSELNEPRWSVVSFEERAAQNLTYADAARKLAELAARKVAGLCVITDEAAERISRR